VRRKIIECLATGFYLGKLRPAPGTWGTLLGVPVVWAFHQASPLAYLLFSGLLLVFAIGVAELYENFSGQHDPGQVVIDEVVGFVIAMTWLPSQWPFYLAAFVLFRFFDILKPFPISVIDKRVRGGVGTILDDVAAGLITNLVLQIVFVKTSWLGVMWDGASYR